MICRNPILLQPQMRIIPQPMRAGGDDEQHDATDESRNASELKRRKWEFRCWIFEQIVWCTSAAFLSVAVTNYWCRKESLTGSAILYVILLWLSPIILGLLVAFGLNLYLHCLGRSYTDYVDQDSTHLLQKLAFRQSIVLLLTGCSVCTGVVLPLLVPRFIPCNNE